MKSKLITGIMLTLLLLSVLVFPFNIQPVEAESAPSVYVDPVISYAGVGEIFSIDVSVADVTSLYGFEFKLGYNMTFLDAIDVLIQPFLNEPTYVLRNEINDESGFVWVAVTSQYPAEPISGNGTLATITFHSTGSGKCVLDLYNTKLSDPYGSPIDHSVEDGYYESGMTRVVSTESTGNSFFPSLAVDLAGNVHIAWHDATDYGGCGSDYDIFYKRYEVGVGWTATEVVSTESTADSRYPCLAVDFGGNVHVAWKDWTDYAGCGADADVFYKRYEVGVGWTATEVVSTESTGDSLDPCLTVDLVGDVHIAWDDATDYAGCGSDYDIFYKSRTSSWSITVVVSTESTATSYDPWLDVDSNGNVHVAWKDWTDYAGCGADADVFYKRYEVGVGWTATEVVSTESTADSYYPCLVADSSGNVHIAWDDATNYAGCGTDSDIFYKRYEVGVGWTAAEVVSTESTGNSYEASLAVDSSQNVHVAWHDWTDYAGCGDDADIFYKYLCLHTSTYPWPMFRHNLRHTAYTESPAPNTNQTQWTYTTDGAVYSSPAVADGKVYVGSRDGDVYALDQQTGALIWNYTTGGFVDSSPAVVDGRVYIGSYDDKVYCFDAATGARIWNYPTGSSVSSSPAVAGSRVYIASQDGKVYCLDAATGVHIWNYSTGGSESSSPAVVGGRVYIGSASGKVYCLDAATGAHIWDYPTGAWVYSSPAVVDDRVYVGSSNAKVYCLAASTGEPIWNQTTGGTVFSSPAVVDGRVYIGSYDDKVYCFDAATGVHIWNYPTDGDVRASPALAGGKVYVGSYDGKVRCLNSATGAPVWNYTTGGAVFSSPAVADGVVFVGSLNHVVYALGDIVRVPEDYPTIQTAIDAADPGATISIAPSTYYGSSPVAVINKTLTLLGRTGSSTTFAGGGSGIAVNITDTSYVTITNIDITYWDQGIYIDNSSDCQIYNNVMYLMGDSGIVVDGENAANNQIYNNIFQDNNVAIDVSEASAGNTIYGNTISQNSIGINVLNSAGNTIYCNSFINNEQQVNISSEPNAWDDDSLGNYWSDYTGTDADGDGIGDTAYFIDSNNQDNYPLMSPYDYWSNAMLGDVNMDAMVNAKDLFQLAAAYGATFGALNWNPHCDLDNDYKIAVLDLFNLSKKYGETAP